MQDIVVFKIEPNSSVPKYQQIVNAVNEAVAKNHLNIGDLLPSVNVVCRKFSLSRDTVFKAYSILKESNVIESVPNKGYYVASNTKKVLLVLDTFKAYKEVLYHSFTNYLGDDVITDVQFHHYNIENFKTIINNSIGKYYKYVIMGFDHKDIPIVLDKIDSNNLLLLDWNIHVQDSNNYVFQDFGKNFYKSLSDIERLFKKYKAIHFLYPEYTNHPIETITYFKKFCKDFGIVGEAVTDCKNLQVERGIAYISVSDRMLGEFLEQCRAKDLEPGKDLGFLSYNDTPMKKFIYKGISVVTTDFKEMGEQAARFVADDAPKQLYVSTKIIIRDSL
ncbi:GntR family transcriptional regulator [Cellulophaga baltica]|uniref:GntR family transcriptional regulator n=1 Tax=Cellulophaga TaxID=104264 RepID=UPI001C0791A5|nr:MULTISPECIES: GntR family transcriptional regulator [Cellulophaga]MBU2998022.1 GntR family transcriptional regulator [Cellulophaga baltica]MDO6769423.1 GntR family transcriptional regulator [Cellulophaga sp. 1_MG-2023]